METEIPCRLLATVVENPLKTDLSLGQTVLQVVGSRHKFNFVETCVGWPNLLASFLESIGKLKKKKTFHGYGLSPIRPKCNHM